MRAHAERLARKGTPAGRWLRRRRLELAEQEAIAGDALGVSVVPIQEAIGSSDCKVSGCDQEALATRGTYAYLCAHHKQARREEYGLDGSPRPATRRAAPAPDGGFEQRARSLVGVGRKLDRALARYRPAKADMETAMAEWREAVAKLANGGAG